MRSALAVLALFAVEANAASSTWIRAASPSVELFTDNNEKTARAVLDRFETLHRIFRDSSVADSPAPLRVYIFSSVREFEKYRSHPRGNGFYQPGEDQDLIVVSAGPMLPRVATHEYLHRVIEHASPLFPRWLDEGLADFYSTISINGSKMRVGGPLPAHLFVLAHEPWMAAQDLALGTSADGHIFYAESWALVHMLNLDPRFKDKMPKFVKSLTEGQDQDEAFTAAFGMSMDEALTSLRIYVRRPREWTFPAPPGEQPEEYQVTRMAPVDATLALAHLALATEHPDLARSLFRKAAAENPASAAAAAGLGSLALAEQRKDDAQREFERAVTLGAPGADVYFELAMLKNDNALLEKALEIDPHFAEAHFLLGVRATDSANFPAAIEHLRQAVAIEPRRFTYWHALGYAHAKSGDRRGAAESARRAAILASSPQEEQMAAALTLLAAEAAEPAAHEKKPDVITPPSWQNRKGDAHAEGTLTRVDCDARPVRLVVSSAGKTIELNVQNPDEVELLNAEGISTTLSCGEQSRPVAIEYVARTGEVTRIEFKQAIIKR